MNLGMKILKVLAAHDLPCDISKISSLWLEKSLCRTACSTMSAPNFLWWRPAVWARSFSKANGANLNPLQYSVQRRVAFPIMGTALMLPAHVALLLGLLLPPLVTGCVFIAPATPIARLPAAAEPQPSNALFPAVRAMQPPSPLLNDVTAAAAIAKPPPTVISARAAPMVARQDKKSVALSAQTSAPASRLPAAPVSIAPEQKQAPRPVAAGPAPVAPPSLDLNSLKEQLKETRAIGVFTKLSLKNQVDDLLQQFRDYYQGGEKITMTQLRRSYDLLLMKVLSLIQDADQRLASEIVASREAIWGLLADRQKFSTLKG